MSFLTPHSLLTTPDTCYLSLLESCWCDKPLRSSESMSWEATWETPSRLAKLPSWANLWITYHTLTFLPTNLLTVNTKTNKDTGLGRASPGWKGISGVGNNQKSGFYHLGFHKRAGTMIWVRTGVITLDDYLGTLATFGDESTQTGGPQGIL